MHRTALVKPFGIPNIDAFTMGLDATLAAARAHGVRDAWPSLATFAHARARGGVLREVSTRRTRARSEPKRSLCRSVGGGHIESLVGMASGVVMHVAGALLTRAHAPMCSPVVSNGARGGYGAIDPWVVVCACDEVLAWEAVLRTSGLEH